MKAKLICIVLLTIAATTVIIISCKKQDTVITNEQDINFFKRDELLKDAFSKLNGTLTDETLLNKVITDFKDYDKVKQVSQNIITKFGRPKWDISVVLKNINGFRTIVTPISNDKNQVTALLLFYQNSINGFNYKIINRKTQQNKLPEYGDKDAKTFTRASLSGLFEVSDKNLTSFYNTMANSQIQTNSVGNLGYTISYVCWFNYSYGTYADGTWYYNTTGTQCSITITVDYQSIIAIGDDGSGNIGGSGGGNPPSQPDCQALEQQAIDKLNKEFEDYRNAEKPSPKEVVVQNIDLNPYTDSKDWDIVSSPFGWRVFATTYFTLSYDDFATNFNRTLSINHLTSKMLSSSNIYTSTWTPDVVPNPIYTGNHTRYPSGKITISGTVHHSMKVDVEITTPCGTIKTKVGPAFDSDYRNTLTIKAG